jgi:DNA-binding XRE family transcriptional regulator
MRHVKAAAVPFETVLAEHLNESEFKRAYKDLEPEFALVRQLIDLRQKRKLTQAQLADRVGVKQPSIARLEGRGQTRDLIFLGRVAQALDARLEIKLVPLKAKGRAGKRKLKA